MEILIGGLASGATGAAATGAAAAGTSIFGLSSTTASILQGGLSIFSALSGIAAGNAEASGIEDQADAKEIEAISEQAKKESRTAALKRELALISGENDVNFAAAGIDISTGAAAAARSTAARDAANQISIDRADADKRKALLRLQATGLRQKASSKRSASKIKAFGTVASTGLKLLKRG